MRIAVVGASNMLGHHVCQAVVAQGHELVLVHQEDSCPEPLAKLALQARQADLSNLARVAKALAKVDAVIMCAAYHPGKPRSWRADVTDALTQMGVFYRACRIHSMQKVVYVGSTVALPVATDGEPATEALRHTLQPKNKNAFLQVKWALDELAMQQARRGLPVVTAMPSMVLGEYDYGPSSGQIITRLVNGTMPVFVDGDRNVIYAGDAAVGIVKVCEDGRVGERYLLTGCNIKVSDLLARIGRLNGVPVPKEGPLRAARLESTLQSLKYRLFGGKLPDISATSMAAMTLGQYLDGSKAREELGFEAAVGIDETIKRASDWFTAEGMIRLAQDAQEQ